MYRNDQAETAIKASILAIVGFLICITTIACGFNGINQYRSIADRYDVTGTVSSEISGKSFIQDGQSYSKFSVPLEDISSDRGSEFGGSKRILNCTSTQCASLDIGQRVTLSCYEQWHAFIPNEEECRFARLK